MTDLPDQALVTRMCFAEERVAGLEALLAWRDISTAPRDGTRVLLWTRTDVEQEDIDWMDAIDDGAGHVILAQIGYYTGSTYSGTAGWEKELVGTPTHWLPLPAPPPGDER